MVIPYRQFPTAMNHFSNDDTIIAPATIPGTGAISLIRISGKDAFTIVDKLVQFKRGSAEQAKCNTVKFGIIPESPNKGSSETGSASPILDEVLCNVYRAPHSYTGQDSVEIMCHASSYIVTAILAKAIELGCRMARPGEFTQRAFLAGKMDLTQAEAVADVIASSTEASHKVAINQMRGGFSKELSSLRSELLEMTSLMELELDFSEEDVEFADRKRLDTLLAKAIDHTENLAKTFKLGNAIKNGIPVAICGPANAGKSTLLNTILGEQRAIVSSIAGTTRDTIEECLNVDGVLFRFVDTAGIRSQEVGEIERIGIEKSYSSIHKAEIIIILLDAVTLSETSSDGIAKSDSIDDNVTDILKNLVQEIDLNSQKVIFAINKSDMAGTKLNNIFVNSKNKIVSLIDNKSISANVPEYEPEFITLCAKDDSSVKSLLRTIAKFEKTRINSSTASSVLVTNIRHYEALVNAANTLRVVQEGLRSGSPTDLIAEDLRSAISILGSITGEITTDDVLGNIFRNFCVGK